MREGWQVVGEYVDDGHTAKAGHLARREGLARLLAAVGTGGVDVVVVVDLDRLTRSEDLTERGQILGALQRGRARVALASSGQVLDLSTSTGDLLGSLFAVVAAEENRRRAERTRRGRRAAALAGRPSARPPWGYRYDRATSRWEHTDAAPVIREWYERVAAGESTEALAADMQRRGVERPGHGRSDRRRWDRAAIYDTIARTAYRGEWAAVDEIVIKLPPIVDEELWARAQARLAAAGRRGKGRTPQTPALLAGRGVCGICGAPVHVQTWTEHDGRPRRGYICARRRRSTRYGEDRCALPIRLVADVDARLWAALAERLAAPDLVRELAAQSVAHADAAAWAADLERAERALADLAGREATLAESFARGHLTGPAWQAAQQAIARQRVGWERQAETARQAGAGAASEIETLRAAEAVLAELRPTLAEADAGERLEVVALLCGPGAIVLAADGSVEAQVALGTGQREDRGCPTHSQSHDAAATGAGLVLRVVAGRA